MTQEFINKFWAALLNKKYPLLWKSDRMPGIVMDFMQKELPEEWEKYLRYMISPRVGLHDQTCGTVRIRTQDLEELLSLSNLTQWMVDHVKDWAYKECPITDCTPALCAKHKDCNYTGRIPIARWDEARQMIEADHEGG